MSHMSLWNEVLSYTPHVTITGIILYMIKKVAEWFGEKVKSTVDKIEDIHLTLKTQTENHLHTIETESTKQTEILHRLVEGQAEANGYLAALTQRK